MIQNQELIGNWYLFYNLSTIFPVDFSKSLVTKSQNLNVVQVLKFANAYKGEECLQKLWKYHYILEQALLLKEDLQYLIKVLEKKLNFPMESLIMDHCAWSSMMPSAMVVSLSYCWS